MEKEFRVYYSGQPATREQLDAIEEIVVDQEMGKAWEARIKIPVCIKDDGSWDGEDDPAYAEFARVRVEIRLGDGEFIPLIEGRIQSQEPDYNATPGQSLVTLVILDDSTLLHRKAESVPFSGQSDGEIVNAIFSSASLGEAPEIDTLPAAPDANSVLNQHGSKMQMLRSIAARYGNYHVYVLPGAAVGTSKGYFKKLPKQPDAGLPTAYLSGPSRNLNEFRVHRNSAQASRVEGSHLSMGDKTIATASAGPNDSLAAPTDGATAGTDADFLSRRLPPGNGDHTDLTEAVNGAAEDTGFTLSAEGSVIPDLFAASLSPYRMLPVRVSNSRFSTNYIVKKVTHTLGISEYTQSFTVIGNAVSPQMGASASAPQPSAAMAAAFNVQVDIF